MLRQRCSGECLCVKSLEDKDFRLMPEGGDYRDVQTHLYNCCLCDRWPAAHLISRAQVGQQPHKGSNGNASQSSPLYALYWTHGFILTCGVFLDLLTTQNIVIHSNLGSGKWFVLVVSHLGTAGTCCSWTQRSQSRRLLTVDNRQMTLRWETCRGHLTPWSFHIYGVLANLYPCFFWLKKEPCATGHFILTVLLFLPLFTSDYLKWML